MRLTNATVSELATRSRYRDAKLPAGANAVVWSGDEGAYYHDGTKRVFEGGNVSNVREAWLLVPFEVGELAATGQIVTFEVGGSEVSRTVAGVDLFRMSVASDISQARLWLEDED